MLILLGIGLAVGLLALLGLSATGHLVNQVREIRRDLTHLAFLQGGLHQEVIGRLDNAASEWRWRYEYLSKAVSDTAFATTGKEGYRPYALAEDESELVVDLEGK